MNLLKSRHRINDLMSVFVTQVKGATAMGQTDINTVSETVLIPLFAEVYGYKNLQNLNTAEHVNYPGIDLGDEVAGVAFQITSTSDVGKVKDTLQKFVKYELYKKYDRLIIYVLTERQKSYSEAAYKSIIQDSFSFNSGKDILDYRNILKDITDFQIDKIHRIQNILESNFGEGNMLLSPQVDEHFTERVHLNLLELFFPQTLYVAELVVDEEQALSNHKYKRQNSSREVVKNKLEQNGLRFGVDWEYYKNQIVTFHNLGDDYLPLAQIVDKGTVTQFSSREFYETDENHERVFKTLLGRCLQQKLYQQRVLWQNEARLFIFADVDGAAIRTESWHDKRESKRVIYERVMKDNKPDEILRCKHLAFSTQYKSFGDKWYLLIKPEWFFSYDGYKQSFYSSESVDWLKKRENNSQVFNHLRFIVYFLKHEKPSNLFVKRRTYPFLSFGKLLSFGSAFALDDNDWNPPPEEKADSGHIPMFDL